MQSKEGSLICSKLRLKHSLTLRCRTCTLTADFPPAPLGKANCSTALPKVFNRGCRCADVSELVWGSHGARQEPMYQKATIFCSFNGTLPSYLRSKCTIPYTLYDFCRPSDIPDSDKSLESIHQRSNNGTEANTYKKVIVTWLLRCKYYMAIASRQACQDYGHNFSADQAYT